MGDEFWNEVELLLHMDGAATWQLDSSDRANDITTVTGSWGRIVGGGGGAFADSSGRTGTTLSSRAEVPHATGFDFDADFTVEGRAFRGASSLTRGIVNVGGTTGSNRSWAIYWNANVLTVELSTSGAAAAITLTSGVISEDVWHDIAIDRAGTTVRLYVDGVMVDSDTLAGALFTSTAALIFGALNGTNSMLSDQVDEWRITKGVARYADDGGYTPSGAPFPEGLPPVIIAPQRVSQHVMLAFAAMDSDPRVSQHVMLVLSEMLARPRVTQHVMLVLADYQPCLTRRAQLWRIQRTDGVVLGFTSHDQPIPFGSITFSPCDSLNASASEQNADVEGVSNMELTGIISDDAISESDILAGKYDDAYIEVFLVSWGDAADGVISADSVRRLAGGWAGTLSAGERGFRAEVQGPGAKLAQKSILQVYTPGCRWEFGDADCGVDIDAMKLTGEVVAVMDNGQMTLSLSAGTADATYDNGFVRWLSGVNAGTDTEIKTINLGTGEVVLWAPAPFLPAVGDDVEVFPGCAKSPEACKEYDNFSEFGGYPHVPGTDDIVATPEAKH